MSNHTTNKMIIEAFLENNHSPYLEFTTKLLECRKILTVLSDFTGEKLKSELLKCANNMLRLKIKAELEYSEKNSVSTNGLVKCNKCGREVERLYGTKKLCFGCFWNDAEEEGISCEAVKEYIVEARAKGMMELTPECEACEDLAYCDEQLYNDCQAKRNAEIFEDRGEDE